MSLGLVSVFFNPCGFRKPIENCANFITNLGSLRSKLTLVELVLDDDKPLFESWGYDYHCVRGTREKNFLWQKECLINYGTSLLPDQYDTFAWLDTDIEFMNPKWVQQTEKVLEEFTVAQLFTRARFLTRLKRFDYARPGVIAQSYAKFTNKAAYGLAWAGRRDCIGERLIDWCITGNADTFMAEGWLHRLSDKRSSGPMYKEYLSWQEGQSHTGGKVGYIPGTVIHHFHGTRHNRRYGFRNKLLVERMFDPRLDIKREGILLEWTDRNPTLRTEVTNWFKARKEDE